MRICVDCGAEEEDGLFVISYHICYECLVDGDFE
jgi:NMD protein affecting ribosome stability and mRNA decay